MFGRPTRWAIAISLIAMFARPAKAQVINFETLPDGSPTTDGQSISTEYLSVFGVSFAVLDPNTGQPIGSPVIAKVGPPGTAFTGCNDEPDTPAPGQGVGMSFLVDGLTGSVLDLLVTYATPVEQASGVIIDVDCHPAPTACEQWTITARNAAGATLDTVVISAPQGPESPDCPGIDPPQGPGNGRAVSWSFNLPGQQIASIRFHQTGSATSGGLAFDNFTPATLPPEPSVTIDSEQSTSCAGSAVTMTANVSGGLAPFTYQWQWESAPGVWTNLGTSGSQVVSPTTTTNYRVTVTDAIARQATSPVFTLSVCPGSGDMNGDGLVNGDDIQLFVEALLGA